MEINLRVQDVSFHSIPLPLSPEVEKSLSQWLPDNLKTVAPIRQQEYVAGRLCAVKAAEKIGIRIESLPQAKTREPIWPKQMIGSISHTQAMAISCVSLSSQFKSIGIDAEEIINDSKIYEILPLIAGQEEISLIEECCPRPKISFGFTVLFSAKEALFKALFPICKTFIGFLEVRMTKLCLVSHSFELELVGKYANLDSLGPTFKGSFSQYRQTIITVITISDHFTT